MNIIEKETRKLYKLYPSWNKLSENGKEIVNSIAMQIPISCEDVATIFITHGCLDKQKTIEYIYKQYGFIVT